MDMPNIQVLSVPSQSNHSQYLLVDGCRAKINYQSNETNGNCEKTLPAIRSILLASRSPK